VPSLTAIIPATNEPATLHRCRAAIDAARAAPEEVIVVSEPSFAGPAASRNAGARDAAGDVLVFVDADVEVHNDAFGRIREAFESDPALVALFGSYDDAPSAPGVVSAFRNLLHHDVHQESAGPATAFWAGLGAVRREDFLRIGGFDAERYAVPSIEDIELGMRLSADGARIELMPEIQGTHLKHWSLWGMVRTDFAQRGVPWVGLIIESRGSSALNLRMKHRLSALASVVGLGALALGRPRISLGSAVVLVALNRRFYGLLVRRRGIPEAAVGVVLHAVHHATSAAAVPFGVLRWARTRRS